MSVINQQYVPDQTKRTFSGTNPVKGITVHGAANTRAGADAQAHANLLARYGVAGSWHATGDDHEVIESYDDTRMCWHAGDGSGPGNKTTLAIEICVNSDGDFAKAVDNSAYWVATKMLKHDVPLSRVFQHHFFSTWGKNCPRELRDNTHGISWDDFLRLVQKHFSALSGEPEKPVTPPPTSGPNLEVDGWWGRGTTSALQEALGTPVDGEVWSQSMRWEDDNPGLTSGWMWTDDPKGSKVMKAFQEWIGLPADDRDGLIGPNTIKALQKKLKAMGYYNGAIDGELWKQSATIKALQKALNDGKVKA